MDQAEVSSAPKNFSALNVFVFLIVGGLSTGLHYSIMTFLVFAFHVPVVQASTIGFALSAAANYLLNLKFTFGNAQPHRIGAPRFLITAACGLVLNFSIVSLLLSLNVDVVFSQIFSTIGVITWNYCVHRFWTFKTTKP
jgi:putative flippase GtrA